MSEKASKNVSVSAAGAANNAPSRPIKLEKITARGIRKNICLESDITRAFTGFPMAWKNEAVAIGGPYIKKAIIYILIKCSVNSL